MEKFTDRELINRRDGFRIPIHHGDFFVLRHLKEFTQTQIPQVIKPGMCVGDIGCGEQPLRELIESCGGKYVGIDVVQNKKNSVDVVADIASIPLPDANFDVIICTEVLEHSFEPVKALQELSRLLKPSGAIIITTPFSYHIHEAPYDFSRLTPFFFEYWLPKLGMKKPDILRLGGNELEVLATVWGNTWKPNEKTGLILRCIFIVMRSVMNLTVLCFGKLFKPFLRCNYFLNIGCVVYKLNDIYTTSV